jgi:anaerobic dimethyl sulfoxide reductase subunit B (iron-sulfur subunit)
MSRRLGFRVDLRGCTGCKACQVACKDEHDLAPGVLWRRVAEVAGGGWSREDEVWRDESRTYFLSVACMHCEEPICVEVCPTKAMTKEEHGIVAVDPERCMGCQYCAWACPYGAPQLDPATGVMTKCDLCRDRLAEDRAPACVAACPTRVLAVEDAAEPTDGLDAVFPLPPAELTRPVSALVPHRDVEGAADPGLGNEEEIGQRARPGRAEWPLVVFTVFAQAAAGLCIGRVVVRWFTPEAAAQASWVPGVALLLLVLGGSMAALHLGRIPAVRFALSNPRSSRLSRELRWAVFFGAGALVLWALGQLDIQTRVMDLGLALIGIVFVERIASVYRLRTVPAWDTWATGTAFMGTALLLGAAGLAVGLTARADSGDLAAIDRAIQVLGSGAALVAVLQLVFFFTHVHGLTRAGGAGAESAASLWTDHLGALVRRSLFALVGASLLLGYAVPGRGSEHPFALGLACALLLASELLGRFLFYASHRRTGL